MAALAWVFVWFVFTELLVAPLSRLSLEESQGPAVPHRFLSCFGIIGISELNKFQLSFWKGACCRSMWWT